MATIYDLVNAKLTSERWTESELDREPFLFEAWFPAVKQIGPEISYLSGKKPSTRVLDLSAYDVPALPIAPEAFKKITTEAPFFKNKMAINEKLRQEILKVIATGNEVYIKALLGKVYDYNKKLLDDARVTREYMRAMLMATGLIAFESNGQAVAYDFGVPTSNKGTVTWSDAKTADPIADIQKYQDAVELEYGFRPTNIVMNRTTFNMLKSAESIRNSVVALTSVLGGTVTVNDTKIKQFILDETGCTLYIYDKGYYDKDTNKYVKFIPDNTVSLFIDEALGNTTFCTTPEEADLMSGSDADVQIVDTGVAITTTKEKDPVRVDTKVSMTVLPTLEIPEGLVILTVN